MQNPITRTLISGLLAITAWAILAVSLGWADGAPCAAEDTPTTTSPSTETTSGKVVKESPPESVWMRIKLARSEGILEGLARADFDSIREHALAMKRFSRLERWARVKNEDYQDELRAFDQANRDLIRQADAKNLEGATLAFFQLTNSCVSCHRVVRDDVPRLRGQGERLTHIAKHLVPYYSDGPQQGRPADGEFSPGTKFAVERQAGSYWLVLSDDGTRGYVAADALQKISTGATTEQEEP